MLSNWWLLKGGKNHIAFKQMLPNIISHFVNFDHKLQLQNKGGRMFVDSKLMFTLR